MCACACGGEGGGWGGGGGGGGGLLPDQNQCSFLTFCVLILCVWSWDGVSAQHPVYTDQ